MAKTKYIYESLGLTEARADELILLTQPAWNKGFESGMTSAGDMLAEIADLLGDKTTPREQAYIISHVYGHAMVAKDHFRRSSGFVIGTQLHG